MTIMDMLGQSGVLTVLGMGIVSGFLIIMVISVSTMGKIIHALGVDKDVRAPSPANSGQASDSVKNSAVAAAITAAVSEYRKDNN